MLQTFLYHSWHSSNGVGILILRFHSCWHGKIRENWSYQKLFNMHMAEIPKRGSQVIGGAVIYSSNEKQRSAKWVGIAYFRFNFFEQKILFLKWYRNCSLWILWIDENLRILKIFLWFELLNKCVGKDRPHQAYRPQRNMSRLRGRGAYPRPDWEGYPSRRDIGPETKVPPGKDLGPESGEGTGNLTGVTPSPTILRMRVIKIV